jgi:hypothetical protein
VLELNHHHELREEEETMIEPTSELRVRHEIAQRIARADRRRAVNRAKAGRRARRAGLEFL